MANIDAAKGFWPVRHLHGNVAIQAKEYIVASGQTVYRGDLVKLVAAGTVQAASAGTGTAVVGVAAEYGVQAASATTTKILVYDDPNLVFAGQAANSSSATVAATAVGATCDHIAGAGNATTHLSGHELNVGTLNASSAAQQVIIVGLHKVVGNDWGASADIEFVINEHHYKGAGVAGV